MAARGQHAEVPDDWFVDPVRLGIPGVRGGGYPERDENPLSWQADSLCAQTDPEAFFPEKGGSTRDAKKICSQCEVKAKCLDYALENEERFGIWGGMSERERRKLSGKKRKDSLPPSEERDKDIIFIRPKAGSRPGHLLELSGASPQDAIAVADEHELYPALVEKLVKASAAEGEDPFRGQRLIDYFTGERLLTKAQELGITYLDLIALLRDDLRSFRDNIAPINERYKSEVSDGSDTFLRACMEDLLIESLGDGVLGEQKRA